MQPQRQPALPRGRDRHDPPERGERIRPIAAPAPSSGAASARPVDRPQLVARAVHQLADEQRRLLLRGRPAVGREDQPIARAGERDVQQPPLLLGVDVAGGIASRRSSFGNRPLPYSRAGHSSSSSCGTKTIGNSRPFAWYSVISRTPSTSSVSSTLVGSSPPAALIGVEVVDEAGEGARRVLLLPVGGEAHEARDVRDHPLRLERVGGDEVEHLAVRRGTARRW